MEALGFNPIVIGIYTLNFFILYFFLRAFAFGPIFRMLDERKQAIADGVNAAEKVRQEAEEQRAQLQQELEVERQKIQQQMAEAASTAAKQREGIISTAREEADRIVAQAREEAQREKDQVMSDLQKQAGQLAMQMTHKIVGATVDAKTQQRLIKEFLAGMN